MKTKIEIKNRFTGKIIFEFEKENNSISETIEEYISQEIKKGINADLREANLREADLRGADLSGADLREAYLRGADLSGANLREANLRGADLSGADLSGANLREANLSEADLRWADLRGAYLRGANLRGANLRGAYLSGADLDKRYMQIARLGSAKRMTTYCFDDDIIWCGCFKGSLEEFEAQVKETHKNNKQYLDEYIGFINYIKFLKENATETIGTEN